MRTCRCRSHYDCEDCIIEYKTKGNGIDCAAYGIVDWNDTSFKGKFRINTKLKQLIVSADKEGWCNCLAVGKICKKCGKFIKESETFVEKIPKNYKNCKKIEIREYFNNNKSTFRYKELN